jgi:ribonuclease BN (tRNA processing enzyme)
VLPRALLLVIVACIAAAGWLATYALWNYRRAAAEIGLLEVRRFEAPTLVALGTGGPYENPARRGPALALGVDTRVVLVDAGRGVTAALRTAGIPITQAESVYLTSLLPENTLGLDDLLVTGWRSGRTQPLGLVGPAGTAALASSIESAQARGIGALAESLGIARQGAAFSVREIANQTRLEMGPINLEATPLEGGPLSALVYRFAAQGRTLVVGSVGFGAETLAETARQADMLVHGAVFLGSLEAAIEAGVEDAERLRREAALELSLAQVARVAERAGVSTLVLVRLRPPPLFDFQFERIVGESFSGRVVIADDGDEFTP